MRQPVLHPREILPHGEVAWVGLKLGVLSLFMPLVTLIIYMLLSKNPERPMLFTYLLAGIVGPILIMVRARHQIGIYRRAYFGAVGYGLGAIGIPGFCLSLVSLLDWTWRGAGLAALALAATVVVVLLFGTVGPILWVVIRRFSQAVSLQDGTLCPTCGYCLVGNTSFVCPECGAHFSPPDLLHFAESAES